MSDQVTDEQLAWTASFCDQPDLVRNGAPTPPPPPLTGAGGTDPPPPPPPGGGPDPNKKFYDQGYKDGSLGGIGVCPAHADADGEAAYNRGYGDGKKAYERRRRAQKLADDSVSGGSNTTDADTGLIAAHMAEKMPVKEMEALQKAGIKVKVTRGNVTNYLTDLKGVHPRDWPEAPLGTRSQAPIGRRPRKSSSRPKTRAAASASCQTPTYLRRKTCSSTNRRMP